MTAKIPVLFMQSQSSYWSIAMLHCLLMRHLDRAYFDVHVACNPGTGPEKSAALQAIEAIPGVYVRPTNFGPEIFDKPKAQAIKTLAATALPAIASPSELAWYIKKHHIKIIHTSQKPRDAIWGVLLAKITGAKSIVHHHIMCGDWMGPLVYWAMRHADTGIACSQFVARSAINIGCAPGKVYPVLNSLDPDLWDYTIDGGAIRQEFGIAPEVPLIVTIARQNQWKGADKVMQALASIKREAPRFTFLIVGDGVPLDTSGQRRYTDVLKELAGELGLAEEVIFTGHRSDVQRILAAADLFAMPSQEEGAGMVFLEAMAMKKPVIAQASGGVPEVVEHGKAGLLSPQDDIPRLAEHILTLFKHPDLRRQMGEYGRRRVEHYFNPQRMAREVGRVYQQALGQAAPELA